MVIEIGWTDCTIKPQKDIAVNMMCEDSCSKTFLESGTVQEGNLVYVGCFSFLTGATETWECIEGELHLRGESIVCGDLWTTSCVFNTNQTSECMNLPWCESKIQEHKAVSCKEDEVAWRKRQADGCFGGVRCEKYFFPSVAANAEPGVPKTFKIYVNITEASDTEETKTYDVLYFLPIIVLLFAPIVYALILRTKTFAPCKRVVSIFMQMCIIGLIVYVFLTRNHLVKEGIESIRNDVEHINLIILLGTYSCLQLVRFLLPPVYFMFPLDSLFIAVLVMKVSLYQAVAIWQVITCAVSLIGFYLLRYCYSDWANRALESEEIEYFKEIRDFLKVFDVHWRSRFDNASLLWQVIYISSLFNAEFCSAYFGLFWMSVRARLKSFTAKMRSEWTFIFSCVLGFILETPAALVQMRLILNALDSVEESRFELFKGFQWYELVPYLIFTGFATCIVQWNNLSALINKILGICCRHDGRTSISNELGSPKLPHITVKVSELQE